MNLELQAREGEAQRERIGELLRLVQIDAQNILALARIAEAHEQQ